MFNPSRLGGVPGPSGIPLPIHHHFQTVVKPQLEQARNEWPPHFYVVLDSVGKNKIDVINVVREIVKCSLGEAQEMVDRAARGDGVVLKTYVSRDEGREIGKQLAAVGASTSMW